MSDLPLLSIVTPSFNAARFLPRALQSIVAGVQEAGFAEGEVEHILIDGASTDGSADLIQAHAEANPRLVSHWRSEPDAGQSDAINRGMSIASGQYATWLNADDWYERGGLAAIANRLSASPPPDVVVGRCRFADEKGKSVMEPQPPEPVSLANLLRLRTQWFNGRLLVQPEVVFRRGLFEKVGGLDLANHYSMDHQLWCRMLMAGARFEQIDALIAAARVHPAQKTSDNREVVRSLLAHSIPILHRARSAIGSDYQAVEAELLAVARKLHVVDAVIRWWRDALAEGPSVRPPVRPEDQPLAPGESQAVMHDALSAAVRPLRWRRRLRIGLIECDAHVAAAVIAAAQRRRLDVHAVSASMRSLSQVCAAVRPLLSSRSSVQAHHWALVAGGFDLAVMQTVSARTEAPRSAVADVWARLAPGGVLVQLDDPHPTQRTRRYIDYLARRMADLLSYDNDTVLHPDADDFVVNVADRFPPPPAVVGVDPRSVLPYLAPRVEQLFLREFGSAGDYPLTRFPPLGPPDVSRVESWVTSVWRRV